MTILAASFVSWVLGLVCGVLLMFYAIGQVND